MADEDVEKPAEAAPEPSPAEDTSSSEPEPKKKKKKKKKRRAVDDTPEKPPGPALGPEGWERPGFVLDFPKDPELDRVVRAFELGNYVFVREEAQKLAEST